MKRLTAFCTATAACLVLAACSSSGGGKAAHTSGAAASGKTITIGLLTDVTGPASAAHVDDVATTKAYFNYINKHGGVGGQQINVVVADSTSTPAGALTAAQKLVEQDKVFAVIEDSLLFFGASPYLIQQHIPVVGSGIDGPEWFDPKNTNLFTPSGATLDSDYVSLAEGQYMKAQGVTSCAAVGYAGQPSSTHAAEGFIESCKAAGLKGAYLNTQVPIGNTDAGPIALAIKASGANGIALEMQGDTSIAIINQLEQLGVHPKSALLAEGYGAQLLASQANVQAAQGIDFTTFGYPDEVHNAATTLRRQILTAAGLKMPPSAGAQYSYLNGIAFVAGLKAAGANPSQSGFITAMRGIKNFDGDGLLPYKVDFSAYTPTYGCLTIVRLIGNQFVPMKPMPVCGAMKKL